MSAMALYSLPQSGSALYAGDEFFETQSVGWSLWNFTSSDGQSTSAAVYPGKHESGAEQSAPAPLEPQQCAQPTDDIFLSQFSDEEMRRMDDAPFEALDMFPDSMHRLLSYEDMLSGVLTGGPSEEDQGGELDRNGVDAMDTCGFPMFSHDLQSARGPSGEETQAETLMAMDEAGTGSMKRSRSFADGEEGGFEALVLEELEDVVFQLTKKTRICFRDALFRLAETSSKARCSGSGRQSVQQAAHGDASRVPAAAGCPERETNAIDRTVADLMRRPLCPVPLQVHGSCCAGGAGPPAQSTTSWTTRA